LALFARQELFRMTL